MGWGKPYPFLLGGQKMNYEITIFENDKKHVFVKNNGENDYEYTRGLELSIPKGQEVEVETHIAKLLFGDWEKEGEYAERKRRENSNIHLYKISTKTAQKDIFKENDEQTFDMAQMKEKEFVDLFEEKEEEKEEKPSKCQAKTKSGKECKGKGLENGYCAIHQPKE